jgi:hypothetical protein
MALLQTPDTSRKGRRVMNKEEYSRLLIECYRSGQMTEQQYQKHLKAGDIIL